MAGDLARSFERHLPLIAHVQIAGVPERHEPDIGEINYPYLFDLMDRLGYAGWVGCEYFPAARTEDGLGWACATASRPEHDARDRRRAGLSARHGSDRTTRCLAFCLLACPRRALYSRATWSERTRSACRKS